MYRQMTPSFMLFIKTLLKIGELTWAYTFQANPA